MDKLYPLTHYKVLMPKTKAYEVFEFVLNQCDLKTHDKPSAQLSSLWNTYQTQYHDKNNNLNGAIFEAIIATVLLLNNVSPLFIQAKVVFVPNVNFDFIVYNKEYGPISISAKTSLRERYKQADLEAVSLKYVHRRSKSYLVTMDEPEANRLMVKKQNGDLLGIDAIVLGNSETFNEMVTFLQSLSLEAPAPVEVITSSRVLSA